MWPSSGQALTGSRSPRTCAGPGGASGSSACRCTCGGEHAPGHVPEVPGLRLQPVRPGGQADPGRVLPGDRAALRGLRPARAAGHVRRLRPVVPVGRRPGRRGSAGDRGAPAGDGYELTLANGETLRARQVVVAVGVEHFAYLPEQLAGLPAGACTHSSAHTDLAAFAGQRVTVVGAGQSALESAALLHEHGAQVQIVMRKEQRGLERRRRWPRTGRCCSGSVSPRPGLGSGWSTWFYSDQAGLVPAPARRAPGYPGRGPRSARPAPAGCAAGSRASSRSWPARRWTRAVSGPEGVRLGLVSGSGARTEVAADHVIAATGYRPDLSRLTFLGRRAAVRAPDRGGHPRGGPRLPDQRPRALRGWPGRGSHLRPGHAVRVRRGSRGPDRGRAAGRRGRPARDVAGGWR